MSANTVIYVRVAKLVTEIVQVSAITMHEAMEQAAELPHVHLVLGASYTKEWLEEHE